MGTSSADAGNAVKAKWVGPNGMQLFDGTILEDGVVIDGVGYDEAQNSDNWEIVSSGEATADASSIRNDWSFGTEEGGGGTGRPELDDQGDAEPSQVAQSVSSSQSRASAGAPPSTGTDTVVDEEAAK